MVNVSVNHSAQIRPVVATIAAVRAANALKASNVMTVHSSVNAALNVPTKPADPTPVVEAAERVPQANSAIPVVNANAHLNVHS